MIENLADIVTEVLRSMYRADWHTLNPIGFRLSADELQVEPCDGRILVHLFTGFTYTAWTVRP